MGKIISIIIGTPIWVWAVLIYLLYVGIKTMNTRVVYLPKLFIIPLVLMAIKYKTFFSQNAFMYITIIFIGTMLSFWAHDNTNLRVLKKQMSVEIPGNYTTLIILLAFFCIKYIFGYLNDTMPEIAVKYEVIELLLNGLFSGYFLGRSMRYLYQFYKT